MQTLQGLNILLGGVLALVQGRFQQKVGALLGESVDDFEQKT